MAKGSIFDDLEDDNEDVKVKPNKKEEEKLTDPDYPNESYRMVYIDDDKEDKEKDKEENQEDQEEEEEKVEKPKKNRREAKEEEEEEEDDFNPFLEASELLKEKIGVSIKESDLPKNNSVEDLVDFVEKVVNESIDNWENYISAKFPAAHQMMLFLDKGGKIEDFISTFKGTDYSLIELDKENIDQQKMIIEQLHKQKGIKEKTIKKIIEDSEDEGNLYDDAKEALAELKEKSEAERKRLLAEQEAKDKKAKEENKQYAQAIKENLTENIFSKYNISADDKSKFSKLILESVHRLDDGNYYLVKPLNSKTLKRTIETEFFGFKSGDIGKFVEAKAKTKIAQAVKRSAQDNKKTSGSNSSGGTKTKTGSIFDALSDD